MNESRPDPDQGRRAALQDAAVPSRRDSSRASLTLRKAAMDFVAAYWDMYKTQAADEDQELLSVRGPLDEQYRMLVRAVLKQAYSAETSTKQP